MANPKLQHKQPFDEEKFSKMVEPFTVRIEKLRGGQRTPIPLPASDDPTMDPGVGWSAANVRGMENWLVTEWAGGGAYEITIVDSSPTPVTMRWSPWFDPNVYPEIIPPPMRDVARAAPVIPIAAQPTFVPFAQPTQQVRPMSAFPNGLPGGQPQYPQQPQQAQYAHPYGYPPPPQYQIPPPPPVGAPGWNAWRNEAEDRRREDELRALREKEALREREAIEAKHKAELERERAQSEARFQRQEQSMNELRQMVAQLTASLQQAQAKPAGESPELIAMRAQMAQQQATLEAQAREREAERRDAAMRDAMRSSQEAVQKQVDALMRQMELQAQAVRESSNNRPDQLLLLIQQMASNNTESIKALANENRMAIERMQNFMMTPTAMFDLATRQNQSMESATDKVAKTFGTVMDMQQRVIENAINLQPGGSGAIDLAREGIDKVTSLVERYTSNKSTEARFAMDAQVKVAQAQAAAIAAQMGPQTVHVPPAPAVQDQLAGPSMNGVPVNGNGAASGPKKIVERFGRTDDEWFGGALLPEVLKLRAGAARFIQSCEAVPPRVDKNGELEGVSPEQAAMAIVQAVGMCMQNNVQVQALTDLLFVDRFADFMFVLIPDAPKNYRDDATEHLIALARKVAAENGGDPSQLDAAIANDKSRADEGSDEDEEDDETDEDGEEQHDGAEVKPPAIAAPATPAPGKPNPTVRRLH